MLAHQQGKQKNTILRTGIIGSIITAICCFTPILIVVFTAIGLAAIVGYLDYVLFPLLAIFLGMIGYGIYKRQ
ncbi:MAG: mercury resistance system transport protein MerF [Candidatus Scalindua sp.]|nr:mercury resistance system transport protein MerF [Candidatus Scalindua sp.]